MHRRGFIAGLSTLLMAVGTVSITTVSITTASITTAVPARAATCPDVELVFARGTSEPAGLGRVGQALRTQLAANLDGRTLGVAAGSVLVRLSTNRRVVVRLLHASEFDSYPSLRGVF